MTTTQVEGILALILLIIIIMMWTIIVASVLKKMCTISRSSGELELALAAHGLKEGAELLLEKRSRLRLL